MKKQGFTLQAEMVENEDEKLFKVQFGSLVIKRTELGQRIPFQMDDFVGERKCEHLLSGL
jgi:hypothetical protein